MPQAFRLSGAAVLTALLFAPQLAKADYLNPNVTVSETLSSVAQSQTVTVLDLGQQSTAGLVSGAPLSFSNGSTESGTISFTGAAGVYAGTAPGTAAAPWIASGPDSSNYLAAEPNGSVTISYSSEQKYLGLLWGSVDTYNTLKLYNNGTLVESLSGSAITANANGSQTANGSYFVNLNTGNGVMFNQVVATSSQPAFEFDTVAFSSQTQAITPAAVAAAGSSSAPTEATVTDTATGKALADPAPMPQLGATPAGMLFAGVGFIFLRRRC